MILILLDISVEAARSLHDDLFATWKYCSTPQYLPSGRDHRWLILFPDEGSLSLIHAIIDEYGVVRLSLWRILQTVRP